MNRRPEGGAWEGRSRGWGATSPTLGGSQSNKLKGEQAEGEGIQTPEAGLQLGWKTVTPARTGGREEGARERVTPSWPSPGSRRAERGWVGPGREDWGRQGWGFSPLTWGVRHHRFRSLFMKQQVMEPRMVAPMTRATPAPTSRGTNRVSRAG